jgi:16S rRNA (uracil1498-N3)-methyltransferase
MQIGDAFLVSCDGVSNLCRLERIESDTVVAEIVEEGYQSTELPVQLYLFQGLPKGDKMEYIVQKSVELGVFGILPVSSSRCVVKLDDKSASKKTVRWQKIAHEAAGQCGRGIIPEILPPTSFDKALEMAKDADLKLFCYEGNPVRPLSDILRSTEGVPKSVFVLIGSEGGFSVEEAQKAKARGFEIAGLGPRILRTETAPLCVLSVLSAFCEL